MFCAKPMDNNFFEHQHILCVLNSPSNKSVVKCRKRNSQIEWRLNKRKKHQWIYTLYIYRRRKRRRMHQTACTIKGKWSWQSFDEQGLNIITSATCRLQIWTATDRNFHLQRFDQTDFYLLNWNRKGANRALTTFFSIQ